MEPGLGFMATDYIQALMARGPLLERFCAQMFDRGRRAGAADVPGRSRPGSPTPTPVAMPASWRWPTRWAALVGPFNYLGLPALSMPVGFDRNGMPVGLQLVGRPFAEGLLLRVAHSFEREAGIAVRRPPA